MTSCDQSLLVESLVSPSSLSRTHKVYLSLGLRGYPGSFGSFGRRDCEFEGSFLPFLNATKKSAPGKSVSDHDVSLPRVGSASRNPGLLCVRDRNEKEGRNKAVFNNVAIGLQMHMRPIIQYMYPSRVRHILYAYAVRMLYLSPTCARKLPSSLRRCHGRPRANTLVCHVPQTFREVFGKEESAVVLLIPRQHVVDGFENADFGRMQGVAVGVTENGDELVAEELDVDGRE